MVAVTGSERTLASGVDVGLEVVRMAVNEQLLMPTLYPSSKATDPKPYASLDKMWQAFGDLSNNRTPVSYTHLRAHETGRNLVCRLLLEKKN